MCFFTRTNEREQNLERMMEGERDDGAVWRLVTDHPDVFEKHVVPKLNVNDVKFFYDVNSESRRAIKRSGVQLPDAFKIGDFYTESTLSWALERCSEEKKRFCEQMTRNGNVELVKFLRGKGCPWDEMTCWRAAEYGHLECLKYAHENECPWDEETCSFAARGGHLECLKYARENGCPWDKETCYFAVAKGQLECLKYAHKKGCPGSDVSVQYVQMMMKCWDCALRGLRAASTCV